MLANVGGDQAKRNRKTYAPDPAQLLLGPGFENRHVEAVADTVGGGRDARDAGAHNGNLGPGQLSIGPGRAGRQRVVDEPLDDLVDEEEGVEQRVGKLRPGRHGVLPQRRQCWDEERRSRSASPPCHAHKYRNMCRAPYLHHHGPGTPDGWSTVRIHRIVRRCKPGAR